MKRTVRLIVFSVAVFAFASCANDKKTQAAVVEQIPNVSVEEAVEEIVSDEMTYSSSVLPWAKNNIAPQTAGRIDNLLVEVGTYVNAGEVVARMDDVQLQQSELQVKNDEIEYARLKSLHEQGGVSQSDFESFEMACRVRKSTYNNLLKNTVLRSPITGVISARNYDKGDMYAMAMPLYTVEQIVPVKMLIGVSETDYCRVKKGNAATISVDAFPGVSFKGTISNVYPTVDANTHTFNVEVKVGNADRKLRPGMYSRVTVSFGKYARVIVPDTAVAKQTGSGDRYVYVYDDTSGTVRYQKVVPGQRLGSRYVILEGVKKGEKVVTEGLLRIKDGVKVNVK